MARLVTPSRSALATELEVQRAVWKDTATAPLSPGHSEEEQDVLCAILNAVSDAVEQLLSGVIEREYSEYADGGSQWLLLRHRPIVAVLEVREGTRTLVEGVDYAVYHHLNRLRRLPGGTGRTETVSWLSGTATVWVRYRAGWATQVRDATDQLVAVQYRPGGEAIRQAVLLWCQALWETGPAAYSVQVGATGFVLNRNVGVPPQVQALLQPYRTVATATAA
jgi:hypothetical protein